MDIIALFCDIDDFFRFRSITLIAARVFWFSVSSFSVSTKGHLRKKILGELHIVRAPDLGESGTNMSKGVTF